MRSLLLLLPTWFVLVSVVGCGRSRLNADGQNGAGGDPTQDAGNPDVTVDGTMPDAGNPDVIVDGGTVPDGGNPDCSADCWHSEYPTTQDLNAIWGAASDDVWVVGAGGTILHSDGTAWTTVPSGTPGGSMASRFNAVWGSASNDVWAGGVNLGLITIAHWDGMAWAPRPFPGSDVNGLWGAGPDDVWAVGGHTQRGAQIAHFDGVEWNLIPVATQFGLNGVWGSGPSDVWAVGNGGVTLRWNGIEWSIASAGSTRDLTGVWGSGEDDVWAVGPEVGILRWDGTAWSTSREPELELGTPGALRRIWGSGPGDVWAAGGNTVVHWDGSSWSGVLPSPGEAVNEEIHGLWGSGTDEIWVVGRAGSIHSLRR